MSRADGLWVALFVLLLGAVAAGLFAVRSRVLSHYSPDQAAQRWQQWKEATEAMAETPDTTARAPVSSDLPPAYILLKDHFAACLVGVLVTTGVFFGVILWMLRGVMTTRTSPA